MTDEIVELGRNQHQLEQYFRRECLDFSGIPNIVPPKELESFVTHALEEIGIKLNKSQIVACHRLGKSERTIAKFLNKTNTENILVNKKKFRDTDIWKIVTDDTEVRSDQSPEV